MALVIADRVKDSTTTTGTGTVTLSGTAATGFQNFSVIGNGNTTYYTIAGQGTTEWEVGIATYASAGPTLARTTILSSSNAGAAVNFSAGTKDVFVTYPSEYATFTLGANTFVGNQAITGTLSTTSTAVIGSSTNGSIQINNAGGNNAASLWFSGASVASANKNWLIDSGNFAGSVLSFAIANSAGGVIGSGATEVGRFSSTGLAVTGTLSATGGYNGTTGATTKNTGAFTTLSSTGTASLCTTSGLVDIGTADVNIGYSKMLSILAPAATAGVLIQVQGSGYPCVANWSYDNAGDNTFQYFYANSAGDLKGSIAYNRAGNVVAYNTTSDATLKNLIGDAPQERSLEILSQTRLREYSWKEDETNKPQIGVIAQELYEVFPGAVKVGGDLAGVDEDGNPTTKYHPWSVDKTAYQFHLVAGWQSHEAKIAALEARLAALEAK